MKKAFAYLIACALSLSLMAGCGAPAQTGPVHSPSSPQPEAEASVIENAAPGAVGTVLLSVNPEIEVKYDEKGMVIEIEGRNDDGRKIVAAYTDFKGKRCEEVVRQLVEQICADGYFEQSVGGKTKNVVVKLEDGSAYPGDEFLQEVARGVREAVKQYDVDAKPVTVEKKDLTEQGYIGLEKAKELVLKQLDLDEADFTDKEYKLDDGRYELEFTCGGVEYEFEVDAVSGKVLEADYERNDDWKQRPAKSAQNAKGEKPEKAEKTEKVEKPAKADKTDKSEKKDTPAAEIITLEKAKEIAVDYLELSGKVVFTDVDEKPDDGKYELEFTCDGVEYDVKINAHTGKVLKIARDDVDDDGRPAKPVQSTRNSKGEKFITLEKARKNALKHLDLDKNAVFTDTEQDLDDGRYELEFTCDGVEYEVDVDARTGEVIRVEKEADDDRDDRYDDDDDRYDDDRYDEDDDDDDRDDRDDDDD